MVEELSPWRAKNLVETIYDLVVVSQSTVMAPVLTNQGESLHLIAAGRHTKAITLAHVRRLPTLTLIVADQARKDGMGIAVVAARVVAKLAEENSVTRSVK